MNDLISRQAAIDVINAVFPVDSMKSEYAQGITCGAALAKTYVEQLPSAQPQLDTCPIYGGMCGYPSNLCYECPRHEGAKERPQWWTEGLQPFAQPQPCKDAVSKADVFETYAELYDIFDDNKEIKNELHKIYDKINALKAAQPQRTKGRWIRKESDLSWWYECSECGESPLYYPYSDEELTPFCPWCGAEMETEGGRG